MITEFNMDMFDIIFTIICILAIGIVYLGVKMHNNSGCKKGPVACSNCGCPNPKKTYDGYWCDWCDNEM